MQVQSVILNRTVPNQITHDLSRPFPGRSCQVDIFDTDGVNQLHFSSFHDIYRFPFVPIRRQGRGKPLQTMTLSSGSEVFQ